MKKLIRWWRGKPRPVRVLCNLLLIALLVLLVWVFRDYPTLTAEQAYRQACAREMIEPGEIIATVQGNWSSRYGGCYIGYERLLAAKNEEGVILCSYREGNNGFFPELGGTVERLRYREAGENVTLMTVRSNGSFWDSDTYVEVPLVLFDEVPKAVRAELDLYLHTSGESNGTPFDEEYEYHLESTRKQSGLFEFCIQAGDGENELGVEAIALRSLCFLFDDFASDYTDYPAAVRLYDRNDVLIYEEELLLRSVAAEAHDKE